MAGRSLRRADEALDEEWRAAWRAQGIKFSLERKCGTLGWGVPGKHKLFVRFGQHLPQMGRHCPRPFQVVEADPVKTVPCDWSV